MASQGVAANSRLAEMQIKFQRKQMLEREQKKLALTGGDFIQTAKSTIGNGKVRQMFDSRRRVAGIDRSHPLRPIETSTTSVNVTTKSTTQQLATSKRLVGASSTLTRPGLINTTAMLNSSTARSSSNNLSLTTNGDNNNNVFHNNLDEIDNIDNESFPKEFSLLSLNSRNVMDTLEPYNFENHNNEHSRILGGTIIINKRTSPKLNDIKLNPVITKKSPTNSTIGKTTTRTPTSVSRASTLSKTTTSSIRSPPKASLSSTNKSITGTISKTNRTKPATFILSVKPPPKIRTPPPGMASCQHCQRHFNEERLVKHEEVCRKMMSKKRKVFDAYKHRVKGTEAENYLKKNKNFGPTAPKSVIATISATAKKSGDKQSNWRKKHEEFITAIREAKKVQAHLARGGKLSDLPPPPPSENPDYIQCPHCSRRFNESAAERHIPKCANMQHNKPKPTKKRF